MQGCPARQAGRGHWLAAATGTPVSTAAALLLAPPPLQPRTAASGGTDPCPFSAYPCGKP